MQPEVWLTVARELDLIQFGQPQGSGPFRLATPLI